MKCAAKIFVERKCGNTGVHYVYATASSAQQYRSPTAGTTSASPRTCTHSTHTRATHTSNTKNAQPPPRRSSSEHTGTGIAQRDAMTHKEAKHMRIYLCAAVR
eukprot:INCI18547.1.p2 GENE.INCI18547.1~~INCI18547.1.p2  ORF type:complete len:103 (+),score=11.60 INCI18547.1:799-1107(+)